MRKQVGAAFHVRTFLEKFPTAYELANRNVSSHKITYTHQRFFDQQIKCLIDDLALEKESVIIFVTDDDIDVKKEIVRRVRETGKPIEIIESDLESFLKSRNYYRI